MNISTDASCDFESMYRVHYVNLCNYALRYVKSTKIAEDVVSETFYLLWKNKETLNEVSHLKSYLYKSVYNNCIFYLRSNKRKVSISEIGLQVLENTPKPEKDALDKIIITELEESIKKAVEKLPNQQMKVFKLKRFENKKNKEVAHELNISIKTVEAHMAKATKTLKQELLHSYPLILICFYL